MPISPEPVTHCAAYQLHIHRHRAQALSAAAAHQSRAELWAARVVLEGAPARWQANADAAFYYLHSSVHPSSPASTSIFGLSYWPDYHYFRGHVMWDIETFALPTGTDLPASSRRTTAPPAPRRPAPTPPSTVTLEHHVSPDVALAFARYLHATGDKRFVIQHGWPVIASVAEWISSRVEKTKRGYEIRRVTGVAETKPPRDNNAFTNIAALLALREAHTIGTWLDQPIDSTWQHIADHIVLSMRGNVILNHDGYAVNQEKAETPEAAAGIFPLGYDPGPVITEATLKFYLDMGSKYAGAPMLSSMLGVYAARLGDRGAALEMFERGYGDFITEPYRLTLEYAPKAFPNNPTQARSPPTSAAASPAVYSGSPA